MHQLMISNDQRLRAIMTVLVTQKAETYPRIFFANPVTYEEQSHNAKLTILGGVHPHEFADMDRALKVWEAEIAKPEFKP